MYYISDIKILSNQANIEVIDSIGEKFYIKEVKRTSDKITVKPTRQLKQGTLQDLEKEIKDIIRGGWYIKEVELIY